MTTPTPQAATGLLPAQTCPGSWCSECDGRPCARLCTFPAGNPRASADADRAAREHGAGAHVHFAARGDLFVVVVPMKEAA